MPKHISPLSITAVNIISRGLYLFLFILIGNIYGSNTLTDDLYLLYSPIAVMITVVTGVAEVVVMPTIHKADEIHCSASFFHKILKFSIFFIVILSLVTIPVFMLVNNKVNLILALLLFPIPVISTISAILANFLNARNRFFTAALSPTFGAVVACTLVIILPHSLVNLCLIFLCYELIRVIYLSFNVRNFLSPDIDTDVKSDVAKNLFSKTIRNAGLMGIGSLLVGLNPMVDILFAKILGDGAISSVEYANRIWNVVPLLLTGTLLIAHSQLSIAAANNNFSAFNVRKLALRIGLIGGLICIVAILLSDTLIALLFGFGVMEKNQIQILSTLLQYYFVGAIPFIIGLVYIRAFSAIGNIKPITTAAIVSILTNLLLNFILIKIYGLNGIGMATSATYLVTTIVLILWFHNLHKNVLPR